MKDIIKKVNVTKVYALIQKIGEDIKKFNRMEKEVFFNAIKKGEILMDPELCSNIMGVGFKKNQPQIQNFMGTLKGNIIDKLKQFKEMQGE